ncbi:MAG: hypothetical protein E5299_01028 [Burkholderia gladioli]|nr:MAG: hypothetical protein E5299_01028 [Burkholderia gladioli]
MADDRSLEMPLGSRRNLLLHVRFQIHVEHLFWIEIRTVRRQVEYLNQRCRINRARSVDVYAHRSGGQPLSSQIPE